MEALMIRIVLAGAIILAIGTSSAVAGMMLSRAALARAVTVTTGVPVDDGQKFLPVPGALRGPIR
jgi:hypothetical protein